MSLLQRYEEDVAAGFQPDAEQKRAVLALDGLCRELVSRYEQARMHGVFHRFARSRHMQSVQGVYLWGGVGRGKTYLMDLFFDSLPFRRKLRSHFNRFMQRVHQELKLLAGERDPLEKLADKLIREAVVICFDEFYVNDITDAMLLGMLFKALFARGVTLVATSNLEPDRLYERGLQRERFLPAIAMLKAQCQVLHMDAGHDYRLRHLDKVPLFYHPLDETAQDALMDAWCHLSGGGEPQSQSLWINERSMSVIAATESLVWLDFHVLCEQMRSQNDYIELSRRYRTVMLQGVPQLGAEQDDAARRFINMVDEFYDRHVKLLMTAQVVPDHLYPEGRLAFEFRRTVSRLIEMQSQQYLDLPHRP